LNFYAGGGVQAGAEFLDPWKGLPDYVDIGKNNCNFLYGLYGSGVLEWFAAPRFALTLQAALPITFSSVISPINWNVGLGLKWNL